MIRHITTIGPYQISAVQTRFGQLYRIEGSRWASKRLLEVVEQARTLIWLDGR